MKEPFCRKCGHSKKVHHTQTGACPKPVGDRPGFYDADGEFHFDANEICRALGWPETEQNIAIVMSQAAQLAAAECPGAEFVVKNHHPTAAAAQAVADDVLKIVREFRAKQN